VKVAHLGEAQIIREFARGLRQRNDVRAGIGDDCAVIGTRNAATWQLWKVDAVIEEIHFRPDADLRRVGWKAVCRAVSDIAAMGGMPTHALVTAALSREMEFSDVKALAAGIRRACAHFDVTLVGGETARSPGPLFINVALTGMVERTRCVLRSGGTPGDVLYVTGRLGGSLKGKHLNFMPRLKEARWLVTHFAINAMIDLSDGLAADLPRLAIASQCGFTLDQKAIPRNRGSSLEDALNDGEDYELLFATSRRTAKKLENAWRAKFPNLPLTCVGALTPKAQGTTKIAARGYDHFA
jgi:thiamine-monophosphate kinase